MTNERSSDPLSVCEHRLQVLCELPRLGGEGYMPLLIEQGSDSKPSGDHCLPRLG
jgi:hypothetical protein